MEERIKEHFKDLRLNQVDKTAIAANFWDEDHNINNEAELLKHKSLKY